MTELSLSKINSQSGYTVMTAEHEGFFEFFTDFGVHYSVGFMPDDCLLSEEAYHLIIANVNNRKSPRDVKVRNTVLSVVDDFFEKNNTTLLYICETGDKKQSMRKRLFEYWFSTYKYKDNFTLISSSVIDLDGLLNHATIIIRNDNPNFAKVIIEFTDTIKLLSMKP